MDRNGIIANAVSELEVGLNDGLARLFDVARSIGRVDTLAALEAWLNYNGMMFTALQQWIDGQLVEIESADHLAAFVGQGVQTVESTRHNVSVRELAIDTYTVSALGKAGVHTVDQLITKTPQWLRSQRTGIGEKRLVAIVAALAQWSLALPEPGPPIR